MPEETDTERRPNKIRSEFFRYNRKHHKKGSGGAGVRGGGCVVLALGLNPKSANAKKYNKKAS